MSQFRAVRKRLADQRQQTSARPPFDVLQRLHGIRDDIAERQRQALEAELRLAEEGDEQTRHDQTGVDHG
jgi:hypothetical protein